MFIIVFLIVNVLLALWVERRGLGRMQTRPGPNVAGPLGLFQAFADAGKLLFKEDMWTRRAERFLYFLAPAIAAFAAFSVYAVIPMGPNVNDLRALDAAAAGRHARRLPVHPGDRRRWACTASSWAAGRPARPCPLYGAVRSSAQVISYELAMGLSLVSVFLMSGSMSTSQIVGRPGTVLVGIHPVPSFVIYCI